MPGFSSKQLILKPLRALLLLPLAFTLSLILLRPRKKINYIVYRPMSSNHTYFQYLPVASTLIICKSAFAMYFRGRGFAVVPLSAIYPLLNLFPFLAQVFLSMFPSLDSIYLSSDYGIDELSLLLSAKCRKLASVTVQHGLFSSESKHDCDGSLSDRCIVASSAQSDILVSSGYKGEITIDNKIFGSYPPPNYSAWKESGFPIVYVGAGYLSNPALRESYIDHLLEISRLFSHLKLIYRPHPRDKRVSSVFLKDYFCTSDSYDSSLTNPSNAVYMGSKSTYLYEAMLAQRVVIPLMVKTLPKYFSDQSELGRIQDIDDALDTCISLIKFNDK